MSESVAIVTGAGGGIGRAICAELSGSGLTVLASDRNQRSAAETAGELADRGGRVHAVECDVTVAEQVAAMVLTARELGQVTVLVNNAGGAGAPSIASTSLDDWQKDLALNLNAAFACFAEVADDLKTAGGNVVNVASVNAFSSYGHPAYSAAKAGMVHLTRLIAVEYGRFGVRANAVVPGSVRTAAWEERAAANPAIFDDIARWYPLGRIATPEDVARAVGFLCGPAAAAITGIALPVDCGLSAGQPPLARQFSQSDDYSG